jgi:hypothetical protein
MKKIIYSIIVAIALLCSLNYCSKDSLEPTLAQQKAVETSITSLEDLQGILYGAYNRITATSYYGRDLIIYGEVRSDNAFANGNSGRFLTAAEMDMGETDAYARDTWTTMYSVIASANILIGQDAASFEGDPAEINHIIGQAYAIRALAHFDLLKLYGQQHVTSGTLGVPYIKEYKGEDLTPPRNTITEVKGFIEADLAQALSLMSADQNDASKQYFTTYGVHALKSRVALYFGDWSTVIAAAETVINSGLYSIVPEADFVASWYLDAAVNSIFELAYSGTDNNNINGLAYIYRGESYGDIQALDDILTIFDAGDVRGSAAMISVDVGGSEVLANMGKYPSMDFSDNISLIRYEEVLLNYAEALFETGAANALTVLNQIPAARGANPYAAVTKTNIMKERRRELCFEGFRFDDLARTQSDIPLVSPFQQTHEGPAYGSFKYAFPIPKVELNANSNMVQNEGY